MCLLQVNDLFHCTCHVRQLFQAYKAVVIGLLNAFSSSSVFLFRSLLTLTLGMNA